MKKKNMMSILVTFFDTDFFIHKVYDKETLEYKMVFCVMIKIQIFLFLQNIVGPEEKVIKHVEKTVNI